jgi:sulfate permease, SulP family
MICQWRRKASCHKQNNQATMPRKTENQQSIVGKIFHELHPSHVLNKQGLMPAIVSGALIGLMTSILSISFAVLVFSKALPEALSVGIGMALLSNVILHFFSSFASSAEGMVSHVQSLPPPFLASMLSSLMGMVPATMAIEEKTALSVFAILLSAVLTGVLLFIFGWKKFGQLVRFLPVPVVSGFLVSVGIALIFGGLGTMTKTTITLFSLSELFSIDLFLMFLPGLTLATVIWIFTSRWKNPLLLPLILACFVQIFYAVGLGMNLSIEEMMNSGLLLGAPQQEQLWQSPQVYLSKMDASFWTLAFSQIGLLATIFLVSLIGSLLTMSAIEFSTGKDLDPNFELKSIGVTNIFSGLMGGGFIGYPSATFTVMQQEFGTNTRLSGIFCALIPLAILVTGTSFHGYIPRFVIGGLLIYFGYQFIDQWVIKLIKDATKSDMVIIAVIVLTSLWFGFLPSVAVGVLASASFFLFKYSKISVFRFVTNGANFRSSVTRNPQHQEWLLNHANRIAVFGLQGYIFFGTAHKLQEDILARAVALDQFKLHCVILDFSHVTGIDTSAVQSFRRLYAQLHKQGTTLVFAKISSVFRRMLQKSGIENAHTPGFLEFGDLDEALEWGEEYLLKTSDLPVYRSSEMVTVLAKQFQNWTIAEILMRYLERMEVMTNTKVITQDEAADDLYFIESGRLSTYRIQADGPPLRLETMIDNTIVGEIGFYLGDLRTATVIAEAPSIVYRLSKESLIQLENEQPAVALALHKYLVVKTAKRVKHISQSMKEFM